MSLPKSIAAILAAALALAACRHRDPPTPPASATDKPINVATLVAGCTDVADCERQCSEQNPNACVSAGHFYEFPHGAAPDAARAFSLYERACAANLPSGCYNEAVLLEAGKGVAQEAARAHQLFAKVCEMGSKTACERAGTAAVAHLAVGGTSSTSTLPSP